MLNLLVPYCPNLKEKISAAKIVIYVCFTEILGSTHFDMKQIRSRNMAPAEGLDC